MENSYMKVEDVLRYLKKNALAIQQYKSSESENHFFKSSDLKAKIGERQFRFMECEITQHIFICRNPLRMI